MFQPLLNRYNTRLQIILDIPLRKTNTGQQVYIFLNRKYKLKLAAVLIM